eukprot:1612713-Rhodomonas_salina.4
MAQQEHRRTRHVSTGQRVRFDFTAEFLYLRAVALPTHAPLSVVNADLRAPTRLVAAYDVSTGHGVANGVGRRGGSDMYPTATSLARMLVGQHGIRQYRTSRSGGIGP